MLFIYCTLRWIGKIRIKINDAYLDTASYISFFFEFWNFMDVAITALCLTYVALEMYLALDQPRREFDITVDHYVELGKYAEFFELAIQVSPHPLSHLRSSRPRFLMLIL